MNRHPGSISPRIGLTVQNWSCRATVIGRVSPVSMTACMAWLMASKWGAGEPTIGWSSWACLPNSEHLYFDGLTEKSCGSWPSPIHDYHQNIQNLHYAWAVSRIWHSSLMAKKIDPFTHCQAEWPSRALQKYNTLLGRQSFQGGDGLPQKHQVKLPFKVAFKSPSTLRNIINPPTLYSHHEP